MPSMRRVSIPSFTASSRSSSVEPPLRMARRSGLDSAMTSYSPCRPLYPVPLQVSQPVPLEKGPSLEFTPSACSSSAVYGCCSLQVEQMRRTKRWATIRLTALATLKGSIPMSTMRVIVEGASFVCSVESTRCPVSAALIAIDPVSRSRISPTMMMFGSWRRNARSAAANVIPPSLRTSTWLMPSKLYSTGSSAEYNLLGINQVLVRNDVGMTFAAALRAFLRQDPTIIMVGDIRDLETGSIAIKAALTGHLVLSTLHTNDAPSTVTRMVDMGIEPFNVASAVNLIVAQRLVRRV